MVVALRGWGVEMPPHCLPESRSQALTGLAAPPPPPKMPTQRPHGLVQTCVSSYSVLTLCILGSNQVAVTKLGQVCFCSMQAGHPVSPSPALPPGHAGRVQCAEPSPHNCHVGTRPGVSRLRR